MAKPSTNGGTSRGDAATQSLVRGLRVMRVFGAGCAELSVSEVAAAADVTRATPRRILLTLAAIGYVTEGDGRFGLSPRVLDLGFSYLSSLELSDLIEPAMAELATRVDFPCSASVLDGDELVIVHIVQGPTHRLLRFNAHVGTRLPAYPGAMGRILLAGLQPGEFAAYLDRVAIVPFTEFTIRTTSELRAAVELARRDGWCLVDRERDLGVISLAVPLIGRLGKVIAAPQREPPCRLAVGGPSPTTILTRAAASTATDQRRAARSQLAAASAPPHRSSRTFFCSAPQEQGSLRRFVCV